MATLIDQEFCARLNALNDKFAASLPGTLGRLRAQRLAFNPDAPNAASAREMHQILHTIAGSAATFGFLVIGQQARGLEQRLRAMMAVDTVAVADWNRWLLALDGYIGWATIDPKAERYSGELDSQ